MKGITKEERAEMNPSEGGKGELSDTRKPWGRAREMGGGNLLVFSWHDTRAEAESEAIKRKGELATSVAFITVYVPSREERELNEVA